MEALALAGEGFSSGGDPAMRRRERLGMRVMDGPLS